MTHTTPLSGESFHHGMKPAVLGPFAKFEEHSFIHSGRSLKFADRQIPDTATIPCNGVHRAPFLTSKHFLSSPIHGMAKVQVKVKVWTLAIAPLT